MALKVKPSQGKRLRANSTFFGTAACVSTLNYWRAGGSRCEARCNYVARSRAQCFLSEAGTNVTRRLDSERCFWPSQDMKKLAGCVLPSRKVLYRGTASGMWMNDLIREWGVIDVGSYPGGNVGKRGRLRCHHHTAISGLYMHVVTLPWQCWKSKIHIRHESRNTDEWV